MDHETLRIQNTGLLTPLVIMVMLALTTGIATAKQPERATPIQSPSDNKQSRAPLKHDTAVRPDTAENHIYPGDVIDINLIGEDWGGEYTVPPSGNIDLKFIDSINVLRKTPSELNNLLVNRLKPDYYRDPDIQVNFKSFGEIRVMVLGAVGEPKHVNLQRNDGIINAIVEASALTQNSQRIKMYVFRQHLNGDTSVYFSDYERYVKGDLSQNVPLRDNDVVYVRTNFWPHFDTLNEVLRTLGFTVNTVDDVQDLSN